MSVAEIDHWGTWMNNVMLAGLVCACAFAAPPAPGTGSIEGNVFNSLTGAPVRKVVVELMTSQVWIRLSAETDAAGGFQFTALPPGSYSLSAKRSGFLDRPARRPIVLGQDEHVTNVEVRLPPQGVISGHVLDEDGDPVSSARAWIFKQVYRDGRKQWDQLNGVSLADETGEYRFPNLTPGRYLVKAENLRPMIYNHYVGPDLQEKSAMSYAPAYYLNAPSEQTASPVEVGVGAEVRDIDIHLSKFAVAPFFHVSGRVTGLPPDSSITVGIFMRSIDGFSRADGTQAGPPEYAFNVRAQPGQYEIFANVYSGGPEAYASSSVNVAGDITGVVLSLNPAPEVTGRISVAENGSQPKLKGVKATLRQLRSQIGVTVVQSDAAGKLVFPKPTAPGHYSLAVDENSIPDGCYLRSVKVGGQEVSADDIEIRFSTEIEIVLSNKAGTITGSIVDNDDKPFPKSRATLIPSDTNSRPAAQIADDAGKFKFTALRPGTYKLLAWEDVDDSSWQDPEFRKKYEGRAKEITVGPSETQNAQLRAIAAEEMN
jgi:protocatechuate 3,4-dioxygenase beta subunit